MKIVDAAEVFELTYSWQDHLDYGPAREAMAL